MVFFSEFRKKFREFYNEKSSVVLDFEKEESEGTKKFFSLIGPFLATLKRGGVLLIDELDTSIHPLLLDKIIDLFNSEYNKKNAQLIFSTHNTRILKNQTLNKDNIWFATKNKYGASELFSLLEIKNVRRSGNFENEYLSGRYGAIPYINDILDRVDVDG
ncbi:AAA family ATPase [Oceanotoga teriensis]|uniref:AAA family ATPase n=1 Tax=Oceanotoga teriensis TaxID=515440 RepID=UPI000D6AFE6A|nr:AAA family ATPase [Oceanotoga teriensis]